MIEGKTKSGFKFKIKEAAADDMETLELLTEIDSGKSANIPEAIERLLGAEQKQALYEHCRMKDGHVSVRKVIAEFQELMESTNETKNS